ncbi:MAG: hypothetical protein P8K79_00685 [Mariniblastus sp.]|jgi:hypothetical protein|nr:hypothetical protein [Mariniblastus sp.]
MFRYLLSFLLVVFLASTATAGTGYEITSKDGEKTITYRVNFGGGRAFEQHTAFDPATKKFVYLTWPRGEAPPKPVYSIWDFQSGQLIDLYQFPGAKHPLPVIPSIEAMKVCPITGDKNFQHKAVIAYD